MPRKKKNAHIKLIISPSKVKDDPLKFLPPDTKKAVRKADTLVSNLSPDIQDIFRRIRFFKPEDPQYWNDLIKSA